ncbi:Uncharacterised protein [Bordetella pertussis]|nr:Uncharacterised protein [Bordetella pertussis]
MRSRYSAFVLDQLDYLLQTWHPDTRPSELEPNAADVKWLGLQIKASQQQDDTHATVEFVARLRQAGRATRLHELSRSSKKSNAGTTWTATSADGAVMQVPAPCGDRHPATCGGGGRMGGCLPSRLAGAMPRQDSTACVCPAGD